MYYQDNILRVPSTQCTSCTFRFKFMTALQCSSWYRDNNSITSLHLFPWPGPHCNADAARSSCRKSFEWWSFTMFTKLIIIIEWYFCTFHWYYGVTSGSMVSLVGLSTLTTSMCFSSRREAETIIPEEKSWIKEEGGKNDVLFWFWSRYPSHSNSYRAYWSCRPQMQAMGVMRKKHSNSVPIWGLILYTMLLACLIPWPWPLV